MPEYMGEMWTREGIDNAHRRLTKIEVELDDIKRNVPPDPALPERLADAATNQIFILDSLGGLNTEEVKDLLVPIFRRAVEGIE